MVFGADLIDQRVIGNPNALPKNVHHARKPAVKFFVRPGAWEERTMDERHRRLSVRIGDGDGEEQRVFVGNVIEVHTLLGLEDRQPQSLPVKQIFRHGERDAWSPR